MFVENGVCRNCIALLLLFSVLQELLQNAEDAGATQVKFVYDCHSYGQCHLHHPDMAVFQVCSFSFYKSVIHRTLVQCAS